MSLIQKAIDAGPDRTTGLSSNQQQVIIMEIVSELMLLTMYQLANCEELHDRPMFFSAAALTMRQHIDIVGATIPANIIVELSRSGTRI